MDTHRTSATPWGVKIDSGFQVWLQISLWCLCFFSFQMSNLGWPGCVCVSSGCLWQRPIRNGNQQENPSISTVYVFKTPSDQWQSPQHLTWEWKWVETHTLYKALSRIHISSFFRCHCLILLLVPLWALSPLLAGTLNVLIKSGEHLQQPLSVVCLRFLGNFSKLTRSIPPLCFSLA